MKLDPATLQLTLLVIIGWSALNTLLLLFVDYKLFKLKRGMNKSFRTIECDVLTLDKRTGGRS